MTRRDRTAKALLYTIRGKAWLAQFDAADQEAARKLVSSLTLVSHSEFEKVTQQIFESVSAYHTHPIGFFAVRELNSARSYFDQYTNPQSGEINALVSGTDHGSEARAAAAIRNFCRTAPDSLLNHPSLIQMRSNKCRTVVLVDDFIGSGKRAAEFLDALWADRTFLSWLSLHYLKIIVVAYSATDEGMKRVGRHRAKPELVVERPCPNLKDMPWGQLLQRTVIEVCERYGRRTSKKHLWAGFGGALAALIFEHGCPNNAPAILWAPETPNKPWKPLFPNRVIMAGEKSVFPPEIVRGDPLITLLDLGQAKLASSVRLIRRGETGEQILLLLALIAKGQRRQSTLSFATGLNRQTCAEILRRCVRWGFLTPSIRLTDRGRAELSAARAQGKLYESPIERGSPYYFPKKLRVAARG